MKTKLSLLTLLAAALVSPRVYAEDSVSIASDSDIITVKDTDYENNEIVYEYDYSGSSYEALGAAIYESGKTVSIEGSVSFVRNSTYTEGVKQWPLAMPDYAMGGAIYAKEVIIAEGAKVEFSKNSVESAYLAYGAKGGAIYTTSSVNVYGTAVFSNNKAIADSGTYEYAYGGAIYAEGGCVFYDGADVTFSGNSAKNGGSAIWGDCTFLAGSAAAFSYNTGGVGAIYGSNCSFSGNIQFVKNKGGAVYATEIVFSGDNATSIFKGNYGRSSGNDIYANGSVTFQDRGSHEFDGGIYSSGAMSVSESSVTFRDGAVNKIGGLTSISNGASVEFESGTTNTFTGGLSISASTLTIGVSSSESVNFTCAKSVTFDKTAQIVIDYDGTIDESISFSTLSWSDSTTLSGVNSLSEGTNIKLLVNGEFYPTDLWSFSIEDNSLVISASENKTIIIKELEQIVNLKTEEYVGIFDASLTDYQGSISGSGNVYSEYTVNFGANASAHTGTTYIDGGKFTIVDVAILGSGEFVVAEAATFTISGTRTFENKLSGAGTFETAGTVTFNGDLSVHTGTTNVASGTLTISESAKLGTGAFDVAGTLALNGNRTFANTTSGDGKIEISSGATAFMQNVGTATLDISSNASATFAGTSNGFAGTLTGAGALTTTQDFALSGNASGFSGKTSVTAGTFTVSESAVLGTGVFEIAGILALNGDRTLVNATSGDGTIEISSGATTFSTDIGTKTLSVVQGASATLSDGVALTHADAEAKVEGALNLNGARDFDATLSGAGTLATNGDVNFSSDASAFAGTTEISSGTFTVFESAKLGTGAFDVSGILALNGDRTFGNATSGDGTIEISSGATSFTTDIGTKTLSVSQGASATLNDGVDLTHVNAEVEVAGTLNLDGDRDFSTKISGVGTISTNGDVNFSSDASAFAGTTEISSGAFTVYESAVLGTGAFDIAGTLALNGNRTFANTTSGDGKIDISSDATTFMQNVGTATLDISSGARAIFSGTSDGFAGTLTGAGSLATMQDFALSGDASGFVGKTSITAGAFTVADTAMLGNGSFDIAGILVLNGDRTLVNATSGDGKIEISSGAMSFTTDIGAKTLSVSQGASATLNDGVDLTHANAEAEVAGTLTLNGDRDFGATLSGAGTLATNGDVNFSSDASAFAGTTEISSGTFTVSESAVLGTGAFDVTGALALNGNRTIVNATSGEGKIEIATGVTTFTTNVGTKTLSVSQDASATLSDDVGLTHADAEAKVAGTLNLNGDRDFSTKISGVGTISTNGNVNFSSDASAFAGTTEISSGTFTVSESAKLGTGAFDIAGTLALNGARTFVNTTSGAGKLDVVSGATTFTQNVGTATLEISSNASATFAGTSNGFAGTLTGAGALTTTQDFALSGNASGFSGKTSVTAGTFTVSESATLGRGAFDISGIVSLKGNRDFSNTLSGGGKFSTSGNVVFDSDISGFTGELNVASGTFSVASGVALDIAGTLSVDSGGTLKVFGGDSMPVAVTAKEGASVVLADGAKIVVDVSTQNTVGFIQTVMSWSNANVSGASLLEKDADISFVVNGSTLSGGDWGFDVTDEGVVVYTIGGTIIISEVGQIVELVRGINAEFDLNLEEYRGELSGSGEVRSAGTVRFSADASEHTGTMFVDAGTFTITDDAQLGSGTFVVGGALRVEGTCDFDKTFTGNGIFGTAGTVSLSGDASGFTGTVNVESGTLTLVETATIGGSDFDVDGTLVVSENVLLGTGAFGVAGKLALNGERSFTNVTSGDGAIEVSSGATTFTTDIGTKTLSVVQGASATLNDSVDLTHANAEAEVAGALNLNGDRDFGATLSGSGTFTTNGNVDFTSDASAFAGTTGISSGTFAVSERSVLGTGAFEIAGTLALNGDRMFGNATSGDGTIEISSGATSFTTDIGTKTLAVVQGASATLNDGVDLTHADAEAEVAGTLNLNGSRDFGATLSGVGTLATNGNVDFTSDASAFAGTTKVSSGTFSVSENAKLGLGAFDIAGTLALNGNRTFANTTSGDGKIDISSGATTFMQNVGTATLDISSGASATFEGSSDGFAGTLVGAGSLATMQDFALSGDASGFSGKTSVTLGTFTVSESAKLGTGAFEIAGILALNGDRTLANETSGDGTIEISSGAMSFTTDIGAKTLLVSQGASATLNDGVELTHANAEARITGRLTLNGDRDFSTTLSGSGTLVTNGNVNFASDASAFAGTTEVSSGIFAISENAKLGTGAFDIAGILALNGNRTFANETSGDGTIEISSGATTFTTDIGAKTLLVSQGASATLNDGVDLTHADAEAEVTGRLNLNGSRDFGATLSGAGTLATNGNVDFTSDASAFAGTTEISSGAFTVSESAKLGTGAFDIAGTLALNGDCTFGNATSGDGTIEISSGVTTFTTDIGTKTLSVSQGASATLNDGVALTHANAVAEVAGTLTLNGDRDFSTNLSGAGKLATNGAVNFGSDTSAFSGEISVESETFVVAQGMTLDISGALSVSDGATLKIFGGDAATVAVSAGDDASIVFADGAKLVVDVTTQDRVGFITTVMGWTAETSVSGLSGSAQKSNILLVLNGSVLDTDEWGYSLSETGLTVYTLGGTVIISETYQVEVLDRGINAMFAPNLAEYRGKISANGEVHSTGVLVFAADSSEHTGTMYVDSGTFTIVDAAQLGSGDYVVAGAGTLRIEGTRDFDKTISGAGTFATSGIITFSGDASAHTGMTKVELGTLTIAQGALLGTGTFDVAGTLVLVGDRTFENATSGTGTLDVASGSLTFTKNVGTATLDISSGASATFAGISDGFSGALMGAGSLTTTQDFALSGDASGFSGKTSVTAGTFTVSETATLGTGTFDIAGILALNGDRTVENTFIGSGAIETAGTILLSGDLSAHTGTTNVKSGILTLADSVMLGTGDFDVSGTLALNGNRMFVNVTSGDGKIEISSGATSFATDIGTKILAIAQGATATLNSGVDLTHADAEAKVAGSLNLNGDRDFGATLSGSGTFDTNGNVDFKSDASAFSGTTKVSSGTFTVSESVVLGTGLFDVSGTLALNGNRTFVNVTNGDGTIEIASATTFETDIGTKNLAIAQGATATLNNGVDMTHADAEAEIAGTLNLNGNRDFSTKISGAGTLVTNGNVDFASDASAFTGTTDVASGAFTVSENAKLGTGDFDVSGALALNGNRTFANATSGDGTIEISSGATTFTTDVGTKTLSVAQGASAMLNNGVDLTHANAESEISGTLNLNGNRDFGATLLGAGTLVTNGNVNFASDASAFTGTTEISSGTFTVSANAKLGSGVFDVSGTLALDGDRTFSNTTLGTGMLDVVSGNLTFTKNVGAATLDISSGASATFSGTSDGFAGTLTGSGLLTTTQNFVLSGNASGFGGKTSVTAGTFMVADTAMLGNGSFEIAGTLALNGTRTFANATSGVGSIEISSGATTFTTNVGTKTLSVVQGAEATLSNGVDLTHANAEADIAGTLTLNGNRDFATNLSGAGTLAINGTVNFGSDTSAFSGEISVESGIFIVEQGTTLDIFGALSVNNGATLKLFGGDGIAADVVADSGASIEFADGAKLLIDVTTQSQVGFITTVMGWALDSVVSGLDLLEKNVDISFVVNGATLSSDAWNYAISDYGLTVYTLGGTIIITEREQIVVLDRGINAMFDPNLGEYVGKISGNGELHSTGIIDFGANASAHTGTTFVDAGIFTIVDAAQLGSGDYVIAGAGTLRIEGTRDFDKTISGAGTFATSGTITFSGDACAHTGTTKVETGTLTIAQGAKLGAGAFNVTGTLVLVGDRTFENATSGTGTLEVASGSLTFTKNVGTATLAISSGSSATFAGTSDGFAGTLTGAGSLTTTQDFALSGDASGFSGKTSVTAGTFTVSESSKLGSGAFEIADTLALNGNRTFVNATSGEGRIEVASGATTFAADVGTKTLIISQGAVATLNAGVDLIHANAEAQIAGTLTLNGERDFSTKISGAGTLETNGDVNFASDASAFAGTTEIEAGRFAVSENAKLGTGVFEVAGALVLVGDRTFENPTSGTGTLEVASGSLTFTKNVGTATLDVSSGASATFAGASDGFSGALTGAGELTTTQCFEFSGDASGFCGKTSVSAGTFTVSESAKLGSGAFEIADTLALNGDRTFVNATSGEGKIEIASGVTTFTTDVGVKTLAVSQGASATLNAGVGLTHANAEAQISGSLNLSGTRVLAAQMSGDGTIVLRRGSDVSFAQSVGVKTLSVENGATLRGNVSLIHGADAELSLAGTLVVNADKGEKVALGGGEAILTNTATLDLIGNGVAARAFSAEIQRLENGEEVTIFEGGRVVGDVVSFLKTDDDLSTYATDYAVVYDTTGGLRVQVVKSTELDASSVKMPDGWQDAFDVLASGFTANYKAGFYSKSELENAGFDTSDPLVHAILTNPESARDMAMNILPGHYAAVVAMKTEAFYSDVRSISSRLEQRRYDRYARTGKTEFFVQMQGNYTENEDDNDSPTFDVNTVGFLAGADYRADARTTLGMTLGVDFGDAKIHNGGGKLEMSDMRFTGFFGKTLADRFYLNAGAQIGSGAFDIKRKTVWGNPLGDATTWNLGGFVEAGGLIPLTDTVFATPYVGLAYMYTYVDDFEEEGAGALWNVDSFYGNSLRARVGCGFSWSVTIADYKCRFGADVAYSHDFLGEEVDVKVKGDFPTMTVNAMPSDMFSAGPTIDVGISENASVYGGYSFNAGTDSSVNHSANVGFRMRF